MPQYIDKDTLVAEIDDWRHNIITGIATLHGRQRVDAAFEHEILGIVRDFIDTLEVKEVDLEKETTHYLLYEHCSPLNEIMHKEDLKSEMQYHKDIENAFKAGFKLGMQVSNKAQKGE